MPNETEKDPSDYIAEYSEELLKQYLDAQEENTLLMDSISGTSV
jgi:hypothetical protein